MQTPVVGNYSASNLTDIELVIVRSKHLEARLETEFGAAGRGLHEKVSNSTHHFSEADIKRLRYIATIRNKIVHEVGYDRIDNRDGFLKACEQADRALDQAGQNRPRYKTHPVIDHRPAHVVTRGGPSGWGCMSVLALLLAVCLLLDWLF